MAERAPRSVSEGGETLTTLVPARHFESDVAQQAAATREAVLRPTTDNLGRPVILVYRPGDRPPGDSARTCDIVLMSMLHFGDDLRLAARDLGMGNFPARILRALVETGSLRRASSSLDISHLTAASEIRDAMRAAEVHSQAGLIARLAGAWVRDPLDGERAVSLLASTFGLKPRDAQVAGLRATGLSRPEAAAALGISPWALAESSLSVFRTLGVTKAPELTRLVADLLLAADLADQAR